jgi:hypothetical protein
MTTAAPELFGAFPLSDDVHAWEWWVQPATGGDIAPGASGYYEIWRLTMPWACNVTTSLTHTGYYDAGVCDLMTLPWGGTASSNSWWGHFVEFCGGVAWAHVEYMAQWRDVAKGTQLICGMEVRNSASSNVTWHASQTVGSVRAFRV